MRQLVTMTKARKEFSGDVVCYLISAIPETIRRGLVGGNDINPGDINPWKSKSQLLIKALEDLEEWRKKRRWQLQCTPPEKRKACP